MNTAHPVVIGTVEDATDAPVSDKALAVNPFERMSLAIVERGGDLAKLDQLLDLQMKWEREQARKAHVSAMASFKAEPIAIVKSKAVGYETSGGDFVGYKHATTADVVDAVVLAMARHGLSHGWSVKQESGQVFVTCTVSHRDGHSESVTMQAAPDNSGKKNAIQQVASTITYLERYTLMAICGVAARDQAEDDGQGYDDEPEADAPLYADWLAALDECGTVEGLHKVRAELVQKFGGIAKVPKPIIDHYNARSASIKGAA